ncbi:hypothetical protein Bca52824_065293 [Brassica carinata]|uniref:Uncharacterized protein n=1 Tax=Brassica carinata TaxID=52824 RepID=A0A8X7QN54_BRACI|nr:hypothetical protein Bca52824_065293 [Brassica carinata]
MSVHHGNPLLQSLASIFFWNMMTSVHACSIADLLLRGHRLGLSEALAYQSHMFRNNTDLSFHSIANWSCVYMAELRMTHRHATEDELRQLRDNGFSAWLRSYVNDGLAEVCYISYPVT